MNLLHTSSAQKLNPLTQFKKSTGLAYGNKHLRTTKGRSTTKCPIVDDLLANTLPSLSSQKILMPKSNQRHPEKAGDKTLEEEMGIIENDKIMLPLDHKKSIIDIIVDDETDPSIPRTNYDTGTNKAQKMNHYFANQELVSPVEKNTLKPYAPPKNICNTPNNLSSQKITKSPVKFDSETPDSVDDVCLADEMTSNINQVFKFPAFLKGKNSTKTQVNSFTHS